MPLEALTPSPQPRRRPRKWKDAVCGLSSSKGADAEAPELRGRTLPRQSHGRRPRGQSQTGSPSLDKDPGVSVGRDSSSMPQFAHYPVVCEKEAPYP